MQTYILLFRGINVGGNNILPMKKFVPLLKANGFTDAYSYIQSGNIILSCDGDPVERVKTLVNGNYGFSPEILVFNKEEFTQIQQDNPYQAFEGKFVHFYFCHQLININLELVNKYIDDFVEVYGDDKTLTADGFDDCIIGVDSHQRVVYDQKKIIDTLAKDMTRAEATEFFYFNIEGAHVGDHTPLYMTVIE